MTSEVIRPARTARAGTSSRPVSLSGVWYAALAAVVLLAAITGGRLGVSYDSVFYWSAAASVADDGAVETGILHSESLSRFGNREGLPAEPGETDARLRDRHPMTAWAPGYPFVVGHTARLLGDVNRAAFLVNLVSLAAVVLLVGALAGRLGGPPAAAVASGLAATLPLVHGAARMLWSETLFIGVMLSSLLLLARWLEEPEEPIAALGAAAIAALATWLRYPGVVLGGMVGAVAALQIARAANRDARRRAALAGFGALAFYAVLVWPLFSRALALGGALGGVERLPSDRSFGPNVLDALGAVFELLPLLRSAVAGPVDTAVSALLFTVGVGVAWIAARRAERAQFGTRHDFPAFGSAVAETPRDVRGTLAVVMLFVAAYSVLLVVLRSRTMFDLLGVRMMLPALVCLLAVVSAALVRAGGIRVALTTAAVVAAFGVTVTVAESRTGGWRSLNGTESSAQPMMQWARAELRGAGDRHVLFADRVEALHFAVSRSVHWLPAPSSLAALRRLPQDELVFVVSRESNYFPCGAYQDAYGRMLDRYASRVVRQPEFAVWFVPTAHAAATQPAPGPERLDVGRLCGPSS